MPYLLDRWLEPSKQALLHAVLVFLAMIVFLPLHLGSFYQPDQSQAPTIGILLLLLTSLGLPYALISSSGPLFQNWYRSQFPDKNPYRLYALSNVGSLLGLLSYPFLIEPVFSLHQQALWWSSGFGLYFIWTLACWWSLRKTVIVDKNHHPAEPVHEQLHATDVVIWLCLAAIASTLLLATTNKLTMDVASVPFLWTLPLTLYLLTFIICFDKPKWYNRKLWIPLLFVVSIFGLQALLRGSNSSIYFQLGAYLALLFVGCMVCHGELYQSRPHPVLLTRYYLVISLGGALGGIFVALVAPTYFNDYYELQLGWVSLFFVTGLSVFASTRFRHRFVDLGAQICWTIWIVGFSTLLFTAASSEKENVMQQVRGFYGVLKLIRHDLPDDHPSGADRLVSLMNGTIIHGTEFLKDDTPLFVPTTYYAENSGIGKAIADHPAATDRGLDVGVVGMGVATISALCMQCNSMLFYEIDPNVVAMEEQWFSNLEMARKSGVQVEVLLGDGRKLLETQLEQDAQPQFDILAVDAFSGDSIPVHLLTREAFELYWKHLRADGVLTVHISNRHLDLKSVVASLAADLGTPAVVVKNETSEDGLIYASEWILLSKSDHLTKGTLAESVSLLEPVAGNSWTDEYSNLLSVLK